MSEKKFEHKDELDCEVTVFKGAHTTCDELDDDSAVSSAPKKTDSGKEKIYRKN